METYKHKGLRRRLVEILVDKGIVDNKVLMAISKIPRHEFLDSAIAEHAYEDKAMAITHGQTISQPYTVAFQTQSLEIKPGDKVLEIGTGSGYQGAILCELGADVYTIERIKELSEKAAAMFQRLGFEPKLFVGDGSLGLPKHGPYDKIIVTAAAPKVQEELIEQLNPNGILVIPVSQRMLIIKKDRFGKLKQKQTGLFKFVPLIGKGGFSEDDED